MKVEIVVDKNEFRYISNYKHQNRTYKMAALDSWYLTIYRDRALHVKFPKKRLRVPRSQFENFDALLNFFVQNYPTKMKQ